MRCPRCGGMSKVEDSRADDGIRIRRRMCQECKRSFYTGEIVLDDGEAALNKIYRDKYGSGWDGQRRKRDEQIHNCGAKMGVTEL